MINKVINKIAIAIINDKFGKDNKDDLSLCVNRYKCLDIKNNYNQLNHEDLLFKKSDDLVKYLENIVINNEKLIIKNNFTQPTLKRLVKDILLVKDETLQKNIGVMLFNKDNIRVVDINVLMGVINKIEFDESIKKSFFINVTSGLIDKLDLTNLNSGFDSKKWLNGLNFVEFKKLNWNDDDIDSIVKLFKKIDFAPNHKLINEKLYELSIFVKENIHPENWFKFDPILEAKEIQDSMINGEEKDLFAIPTTEIDKIIISTEGLKQKFPFLEKEKVMLPALLTKILTTSKQQLQIDKIRVNLSLEKDSIHIEYEFNIELNKEDVKQNTKYVLSSLFYLLNDEVKDKRIKSLDYDYGFFKRYEQNIEKIILQNEISTNDGWVKDKEINKNSRKNKI